MRTSLSRRLVRFAVVATLALSGLFMQAQPAAADGLCVEVDTWLGGAGACVPIPI